MSFRSATVVCVPGDMHLQSLPGVTKQWHARLEALKKASLNDFIGLIEQLRENNSQIDPKGLLKK